jgi:hypothetical protein
VRPILFCLTLLTAVACETTTTTITGIGGAGGGALTLGQATGNWSFTVRQTTTLPCSTGSLADGTVVTAHLNVLADGTLTSSTWQNPTSTSVNPVTGTVTLTTGSTDLILSGSSGTNSGMELRGTMTATSTFTGTLTDPAPGLSPMFSVACEYSTSGTKA